MDTTEISKKVQKYITDSDVTQVELASLLAIDQSQISRIVNGDFKRISRNVKKICEYANIDLNFVIENRNPAENTELMEAISLVWDGTRKKAHALAKVIRSLKELS